MLYGGGIPTLWDFAGGPLPATLADVDKTEGKVRMRIADDPRGPWSPPVDAIGPQNSEICDKLHAAPGVWLEPPSARCGPNGVPQSDFPAVVGPGLLYAPSVAEPMNKGSQYEPRIGWFVSTWNPYEVHQMRTTISIVH